MTAPMQVGLPRRAPGLAGGGRDSADRARVAVRPPDADRRRPRRAGVRGLDAPLRARRADRASAPRAAGDQQPLPAAGDAGQDRRDRRRRVGRPARLRDRRGLAAEPSDRPPRVRGSRPAVPRLRPLGRQPRRGVHGHPAPVDRERAVRLRRRATSSSPERSATPSRVQRPHPPIIIGGRTTATLRVVAEHADLWNIPGGDIDDAVRRSARLDRCVPRSGATRPRSPARSICRSPTTTPRRPEVRSPRPSTPASAT